MGKASAPAGASAAARQQPKLRDGEVSPGIFLVQYILDHELLEDETFGVWVKWRQWPRSAATLERLDTIGADSYAFAQYARLVEKKRKREILTSDYVSAGKLCLCLLLIVAATGCAEPSAAFARPDERLSRQRCTV